MHLLEGMHFKKKTLLVSIQICQWHFRDYFLYSYYYFRFID